MNKDWAEKNKRMQSLIGKAVSYREGIDALVDLRNDLFGQIMINCICREYKDFQLDFSLKI